MTAPAEKPAVSPPYELGPETNRLEPQVCVVCGLDIPPGRLAFRRVARGQFEPHHRECRQDPQPARIGGSAT